MSGTNKFMQKKKEIGSHCEALAHIWYSSFFLLELFFVIVENWHCGRKKIGSSSQIEIKKLQFCSVHVVPREKVSKDHFFQIVLIFFQYMNTVYHTVYTCKSAAVTAGNPINAEQDDKFLLKVAILFSVANFYIIFPHYFYFLLVLTEPSQFRATSVCGFRQQHHYSSERSPSTPHVLHTQTQIVSALWLHRLSAHRCINADLLFCLGVSSEGEHGSNKGATTPLWKVC